MTDNKEDSTPLLKEEDKVKEEAAPAGIPPEEPDYPEDIGDVPEKRENSDSQGQQYRDGQELSFVKVRFPGQSNASPFVLKGKKHAPEQRVVALSERGLAVGYVSSFPYKVAYRPEMGPLKTISKIATDADLSLEKETIEQERKAKVICEDLIFQHKLEMSLTHIEFTQYGKKAVFYFTAPDRVDFRNLVRDLVGQLKMRIELRQISLRDRASCVGGIGTCGLQLCCRTFLQDYGRVSIKMAKNQNFALASNRLHGVCGQVKCCIAYEDSVYHDKRSKLPTQNSIIKTRSGDLGKVIRLHLLIEQFELMTDQGVLKRYVSAEFDPAQVFPKDHPFPKYFDHVSDETSKIVGFIKPVEKEFFDFGQSSNLENENEDVTVQEPVEQETLPDTDTEEFDQEEHIAETTENVSVPANATEATSSTTTQPGPNSGTNPNNGPDRYPYPRGRRRRNRGGGGQRSPQGSGQNNPR